MERIRSGLQVERRTVSQRNSSIPTRRVESLDTFMVEHKFWDRSRDICIAHQRQRTIVKDKPLTIDASCDRSVIFGRALLIRLT